MPHLSKQTLRRLVAFNQMKNKPSQALYSAKRLFVEPEDKVPLFAAAFLAEKEKADDQSPS